MKMNIENVISYGFFVSFAATAIWREIAHWELGNIHQILYTDHFLIEI